MAYDSTDFVVTEVPPPVVRHADRIELLRDTILLANAFCMDNPSPSECGSPSCFCGWARSIFFDGKYESREGVAEHLGLDPLQASVLFQMDTAGEAIDADERAWAATPQKAAAVLTNYLATGQIDWSVA